MIEKLSWREEKLLPRKIVFTSLKVSNSEKSHEVPDFLHWRNRGSLSSGFKNVGNTCFLNSTLQCLLHTPPMHNLSHSCSKGFCIVCAVRRLYNSRSSVPEEFLMSIPRLSRQFQIGRQADAHELLRFLVDRIEPKDFKEKIFGGQLQSTVKCKECRYESVTNEPFFDLSLEVSGNDIEKCITDFCREEILSGENRYNCPQCKRKTVATKQFLIKTAPNILTIQLKRFTNQGKKDSRTVRFGETITLDSSLLYSQPIIYRLYAVLVHVGFGCRSGHYYSFIKAPNDMWFEANDSCISQASLSRVLSNNGAYILMYKRDSPRPKIFENSVADNRNSSEISPVLPSKSMAHPEHTLMPVKKQKFETYKPQNFKNYWSQGSLHLGYVKDEYDRRLDFGKNKKKKNNKRHLSANVWDRVKLRYF
ncbi:hypothetical protein SteCoe_14925 [Stentor coeruleus]|uniref:Ubiquitin carboxyl-terminal hydrolase n=1 Tax=Stentor coeruleus TaxID=5963 RepID=A0A1R2C4V2_9CILI|nr:hypothetical protein SteCoe_14925 [Stentor coeruleus]